MITSLLRSNTFYLFSLMFVIFMTIMLKLDGMTDLPTHVQLAREKMMDGHLFSGNFMMYFILNLLSGFSCNRKVMKVILCLLLACSKIFCYKLFSDELSIYSSKKTANTISFCLLFIFVIPVFYFLGLIGLDSDNNFMYLGYFVPNVWHNSTIILSMPFAIGAYMVSSRMLEQYSRQDNIKLTFLIVLCTLIKPSFSFVFCVAFPVLAILKYKLTPTMLKCMIPVVCAVLCNLYIYCSLFLDGNQTGGNGVCISILPLFTTDFWRDKIPYMLVSLFLPGIYLCLNFKKSVSDLNFWYILIMLVTSIGVLFMCSETGDRALHGNFGWQIIPVMLIFYYYVTKNVLIDSVTKIKGKNDFAIFEIGYGNLIIAFMLFLHVVSGFYYLIRIITQNTYF